jgi:hypothetical protein
VRRLLSMLVLLTAAGTLVPAASASAGTTPGARPSQQRFGASLYDIPVIDAHNPRGLRYIIDFLPSGTVIHRRILVLNEESRTAHFTVYPDAAQIAHGQFTGDSGETRSELTSWIKVRHPSVTLPPHGRALDMVTIAVPKVATRGEHYGVIWVQQVAHARSASGFAINEVARVGIRIYLAVGHGGAPPTRFVITSLTAQRSASGRPLLLARVRDNGGRAVDLGGHAHLSQGPGGTAAGPFQEQRIVTLAPGQSGNVIFAMGAGLPAGPWRAAVTLVSGFTSGTARGSVQFPDNQPAAAGAHVPLMILVGGLLTLVIFALAFVLIIRTRSARHRHARRGHA